jgi:hypothetical protein
LISTELNHVPIDIPQLVSLVRLGVGTKLLQQDTANTETDVLVLGWTGWNGLCRRIGQWYLISICNTPRTELRGWVVVEVWRILALKLMVLHITLLGIVKIVKSPLQLARTGLDSWASRAGSVDLIGT